MWGGKKRHYPVSRTRAGDKDWPFPAPATGVPRPGMADNRGYPADAEWAAQELLLRVGLVIVRFRM